MAKNDVRHRASAEASPASARKSGQLVKESDSERPLGRLNFIFMAVAGLMIIVGFLLMLGAPSTTDTFNPDIFSTRRVVVGPMIAFLGFVGMAVAIVLSPAKKGSDKAASAPCEGEPVSEA